MLLSNHMGSLVRRQPGAQRSVQNIVFVFGAVGGDVCGAFRADFSFHCIISAFLFGHCATNASNPGKSGWVLLRFEALDIYYIDSTGDGLCAS